MEIKKRHIIALDLLIVVGSLIFIMWLVGYSRPLVIAPINDMNTTSTSVLFEFEKADLILIDDNLEFTSPDEIYVKDNLVVNLKPGIYYWKAKGSLESQVRKLTILSEVNLKIKEGNDKVELVNSGNTELEVNIYNQDTLVGNVSLSVDESTNVSGSLIIGGQNE